ncbi:MAG: hypothetical protein AB7D27_09845 [Desulfomicrobium sp.]
MSGSAIRFDVFKDNSLLLHLRCFIGSVNDRVSATSSIERKFREAGICIAFPQSDVHLDTARTLEIRISREKKAGLQGADESGE